MKEIFSGEVYEILPLSNGILFSYCKERIDDNVVVAYKMISFENSLFTDVAKNVYLLTKFGNNYKSVIELCNNYITVKSIVLPSGKIFLLERDGRALLLDNDAAPVWTGNFSYRSYPPSDIALCGDALWATYPDCNVLLRYNLATMHEELRIGGSKSPFQRPRSLFATGDKIMVSNLDSQKLIEIDLNDYSVFEYEKFDEPVYQYVKVGDNRFALLKSGLYLIA